MADLVRRDTEIVVPTGGVTQTRHALLRPPEDASSGKGSATVVHRAVDVDEIKDNSDRAMLVAQSLLSHGDDGGVPTHAPLDVGKPAQPAPHARSAGPLATARRFPERVVTA
jgi:hypothetical protein